MSEPLQIDYLKPFIESTIAASVRFRRVLIVMITASILALGAFWNSLEGTWFNSRIITARKAEAYLTLEEIYARLTEIEKELGKPQQKPAQAPQDTEQQKEEARKLEQLEEHRQQLREEQAKLLSKAAKPLLTRFDDVLTARFNDEIATEQGGEATYSLTKYFIDKDKPTQLHARITELLSKATHALRQYFTLGLSTEALGTELQRKDYAPVTNWINRRMLPDRQQVTQYAQKLEENRTEKVILINIPFFGNVFDVNALALWGGVTFTVILMLLRFSLWREYNNLRLTFEEAKPKHLRFCYRSLAMEQVFTVPPPLILRRPYLKPRGRVVRLLYLPPLFIQTAVICNDYKTLDIGEMVSSFLAPFSIFASALFFFFILALTIRCLQLALAIDKEWADAADKIISLDPARALADTQKSLTPPATGAPWLALHFGPDES